MTSEVERDLERFYSLLGRLAKAPGQARALIDLPQRSALPSRGVYFFFEPGESRASEPAPRVVRIGTHAVSTGSQSTLHGRLKQHFGTRSGGGNHRGSIFRLHVGAALLARDGVKSATWGVGSSVPPALREDETGRAAERALEKRVSEHIGVMPVCWINVPDEASAQSDRSYIERNAIALISNHCAPIDLPSHTWLGRSSSRREIRNSGLWNLNYVDGDYEPAFLDKLESLVSFPIE